MNETLYPALGMAVRKHREQLGLSQSALGSRVKMARTTITNIEAGGQNIMMHQFVELANALRVKPVELLEEIGDLQAPESAEEQDPAMESLLMKLTKPIKAPRA